MKIASQGWRFIVPGLVVFLLGLPFAAGRWLSAAALIEVLFMFWFFRDPDRPLPSDASQIYSPGDGRVISVARETAGEEYTIRIFLSPIDVHVQRAPCSGRVVAKSYTPGGFVAAMKGDARANERASLSLEVEGRKDRLTFEQVTGFLVRRIETWPKEGDVIRAGERYGIMYFGSQCAVYLPKTARPTVAPGDKVIGGVSVIAQWIS